MSKSSNNNDNNNKLSKAAPLKPQRVPTIRLNKKPDILSKRSSETKKSYQDSIEASFSTGNLHDINPPKFKLYSIFDVIIPY